jgi:sortase A
VSDQPESSGTGTTGTAANTRTEAGVARRRLTSVMGVAGEVLITFGLVILLFLGWYVWLNDIITGSAQQSAAHSVQEQLRADFDRERGEQPGGENPREPVDPSEPVVREAPAVGEAFGTLRVPRFGSDYVRTIGEGVDLATVLNRSDLGIGRYPGTSMPGEIGNVALAAHRTTYGAPFADIAELRPGDPLYIETVDGWYEYRFRNLEYVLPTAVQVLQPVPQAPQVAAGDRILTLTSCNPRFSAAERVIGYAVMEQWYPREQGPPAEIADQLEAGA